MSITPAEKLVDFIGNFIDYVYNNIETMYGVEHDNEHQPIVMPQCIQINCLGQWKCYLAADFSSYWWGYNSWGFLYSYDFSVFDGNATYSNFVKIGRYDKTQWDKIHEYSEGTPNPDVGDTILSDYIESHNQLYFDNTTSPQETVYPVYSIDNNAVVVMLDTENHQSNLLYSKYPKYDYTAAAMTVNVVLKENSISENNGYYICTTDPPSIPDTHNEGRLKDGFLATRMNDTSVINKYITDNNSEHNYTYTYETENGDEVTVYYGDNYVIYKCDDDTQITYDDNYNIINKIKDDTDLPIENPTYHDKKYGPEPEPITDDDYVEMGLGVETDGMAMYNMAVVTRDDLIALITDFEANSDTGLSFIPHVLGLYKLGISSSQLLTTITDKIRLHKEPDKTAFASAADYSIVDEQETYIDCGSITVDREELLTNTFLDFSPYTTYEMFIPGCGWITLPDTIVGRTLTVTIVFDLATCSCKGIVRCGTTLLKSGTTIATVNGIIGSSVPLSINETGLQKAAIMNGSTQAAMALGTAFMGVGIGNPYMGASGVAMAAGALASNHIAGNSTYTNTKGGATDYSIFGDGWKAVLKITRPVLEIPDNYGHTVGFVVNRYAQLSEFSGFTVCVNPHIHITATSDEKEEIKRLLEEGVILPEGE